MRGLIIITAFFLAVPAIFAREQSQLARVTVYWASGGKGSDHYTRQHKTATGLRLRTGHCAVDPRHIPYGSKVVLPDGSSLAAVDTGTAVKNRKAARRSGRTTDERNAVVIDRFFETKGQALAWANTHPAFMPVRVVPPNYRSVQPQQSQIIVNNSGRVTSPTLTANSAPILKAQPATSSALVVSNEPIVRNPLNRLGR